MLSIGEFASLGRVTVRLLRYYDEIGLLKPAQVDPVSNYRSYAQAQVPVLTRILQLRDFGLRLDDIATIVNAPADPGTERELLRAARSQLSDQIADARMRMDPIDAYLKTTGGQPMPATIAVEISSVAPQRVAYLTGIAGGWGDRHIGPVIGPLFGQLERALSSARVTNAGPGIAIYEAQETGDQTTVLVTAAIAVDNTVGEHPGYRLSTLPAIESAAMAVHRGEVATIDQSWHALMDWVSSHGYQLTGICREVYLTPSDRPQAEWVTNLLQPIAAARS